MSRSARYRIPVLLTVVALLLSLAPAASAAKPPKTSGPLSEKAIFFAADGMRPDLMEQFAADGDMPTYANLMATGVRGDNGLTQAFPPNTGVGWYTLATGTYPSEHGSTNNTFYRTGESDFNNRTSLGSPIAPGRHPSAGRGARRQEGCLRRVGGLTHP